MSRPMVQRPVGAAIALRDDALANALLEEWLGERRQPCSLFLDVDGTLLDIAESPDAVHVPRELCVALESLHRRLDGALALVSGRPVDSLDRLFAPLRLPSCGSHGAHWRVHAGEPLRHEAERPLPAPVRQRLQALARAHPGVLVEDKGSSVALHYRQVPDAGPPLASALRELLGEPAGAGLRLLPGKMVYEVIAHSSDKAQAIRRYLDAPPFAGRRPLFIGDDVTDEPALAMMPALGGLALSVGHLLPGASASFADAASVRAALDRAARRTSR
ncbi:trehalose-phosphatase [Pseudomonas schmalbachii]|uniref:Trehalose 6-phosphate phosphatase n=1 Tax=Pseudomonas schmalbachii TaxID=2816993 RepID=A0ABS3TLT5_9PSED|nr:trehalose-phosphatase [Pseudomonas schmalbachii]MBO3274358.1 trehalose-phosphatase [Pseudomonas schmalbachii]